MAMANPGNLENGDEKMGAGAGAEAAGEGNDKGRVALMGVEVTPKNGLTKDQERFIRDWEESLSIQIRMAQAAFYEGIGLSATIATVIPERKNLSEELSPEIVRVGGEPLAKCFGGKPHFALETELKTYKKMLNAMSYFYRETFRSSGLFPPSHLRRGLVVVANVEGEYHRALVLSVIYPDIKDEFVSIGNPWTVPGGPVSIWAFLLDLGTHVIVRTDRLYFMLEEYAKLPQMAFSLDLLYWKEMSDWYTAKGLLEARSGIWEGNLTARQVKQEGSGSLPWILFSPLCKEENYPMGIMGYVRDRVMFETSRTRLGVPGEAEVKERVKVEEEDNKKKAKAIKEGAVVPEEVPRQRLDKNKRPIRPSLHFPQIRLDLDPFSADHGGKWEKGPGPQVPLILFTNRWIRFRVCGIHQEHGYAGLQPLEMVGIVTSLEKHLKACRPFIDGQTGGSRLHVTVGSSWTLKWNCAWYRVIVLDLGGPKGVIVLFVDNGTIKKDVSPTLLFPISPSEVHLPAAGCTAKLYKEQKGKVAKDPMTGDELWDEAYGKDLIGRITSLTYQGPGPFILAHIQLKALLSKDDPSPPTDVNVNGEVVANI